MRNFFRNFSGILRVWPIALVALLFQFPVQALDNIVHPYQSVRSAGMGGLLMTTGLYEENIFGNPARAAANPKFKLTILDPSVEFNADAISNIQSIIGGLGSTTSIVNGLKSTVGKITHTRLQMTPFAAYFNIERIKMNFAIVPLTVSALTNFDLRSSYRIDTQAIADASSTITVARRFLKDDMLSVGLNTHFWYRLSTIDYLDLSEVISRSAGSAVTLLGQGAMVDFDFGSTFTLPWHPWELDFQFGASLNNIAGGGFNMIQLSLVPGVTSAPTQQGRTLGLGFRVTKKTLWKFKDMTLGLDVQDIGHNPNGSAFKTVHLGFETGLSVFRFRAGVNQGYWALGIGLDARFFVLEYSTYGEEMGLAMGTIENRIHAIKMAFQIN